MQGRVIFAAWAGVGALAALATFAYIRAGADEGPKARTAALWSTGAVVPGAGFVAEVAVRIVLRQRNLALSYMLLPTLFWILIGPVFFACSVVTLFGGMTTPRLQLLRIVHVAMWGMSSWAAMAGAASIA